MYLKEIQLYMSRAYGPGSYDASYEKQGRDYPLALRALDRESQHGGVPAPDRHGAHRRAPADHARIFAGRSGQGVRHDLRSGGGRAWPCCCAIPRHRRRIRWRHSRRSARSRLRRAKAGQRSASNSRWWARATWPSGSTCRISRNCPEWDCARCIRRPACEARATRCASARRTPARNTKRCCAIPQVDAVLIASRNQHHAAQSLAALRAGKHVFVEKPMALTAEECRELCAAVEESGKQLTVGFNRRFAPFYRELKQNLERRNSPAVVQCRINSPGISGSYWMADPAIGGAILGEACHFIDLMYWLLDAEPVSVSAYSLPTGKADPIGENNLVASFRFADGSDRQSHVLHGGQQDVGRRARGGLRAGRRRFHRRFQARERAQRYALGTFADVARQGLRRADGRFRREHTAGARAGGHRLRRRTRHAGLPGHDGFGARRSAGGARSGQDAV